MNNMRRMPYALGVFTAVTLLVGCWSNGSQSHLTPLVLGQRSQALYSSFGSGLEQTLGLRARQRPAGIFSDKDPSSALPDGSSALLFVAEQEGSSASYVAIFGSHSKQPVRTISKGLDGAMGEWVDRNGNLYVANWRGATVREYAPGSTSPTFTYSANLVDPVNVTTDAAGNIYAVDYNNGNPGYVVEYRQGSNVPAQTYSINGSPEGAAFTHTGTLFVDYVLSSTRKSRIERFPKGSKTGQDIGPWFDWVGGMLVDKNDSLVVCIQTLGEVDILPAPYRKVMRKINHFTTPFRSSFSGTGRLLYVADPGASQVDVIEYSTGSVVKRLGATNDLYLPLGVASSPELQ